MTAPVAPAPPEAGLRSTDPVLYDLLDRERARQHDTLAMIASASSADASVLACVGSELGNVTAEGYPGARFHAGCEVADQIERLAVERARSVFGARYANVQPHSGTTANQIVLTSLLDPGATILGQRLDSGGHLTHGARPSFTGRYFNGVGYGVGPDGLIDYDEVESLAQRHRPGVIICGASAYPREIHFDRFRSIADEVGAYLLADISHIAGLVATGRHPSPVDIAHVTTTSTYKQLYGPRGGLILSGLDADVPVPGGARLRETLQRAVFPYFQGTPQLNAIAGKARALAIAGTADFATLTDRILDGAQALAQVLESRGWRIVSGGTDNHMVLADVTSLGLTGVIAEKALERCGILTNKNTIPGDRHGPTVAGGLRLGTNTLALRGMDATATAECGRLVDDVCRAVRPRGDSSFELPEAIREAASDHVARMCRTYPLPT